MFRESATPSLIPLPTFYELEKVGSDQVVGLFIHTHVREGAIELFGFWNEKEKLLFEKLILVSGIGPKLARVILSGCPRSSCSRRWRRGTRRACHHSRHRQEDRRAHGGGLEGQGPGAGQGDGPTGLGRRDRDRPRPGPRQPRLQRIPGAASRLQAREQNPEAPFHELLRLSLQSLARI